MLESIPGTAGIMIPPPGYLAGVRELCDRYGILWIADEVMSGFGRAGRWFACELGGDGAEPDLVTFAKGVNSGYVPLGGVLVSRAVYDTFAERPFPGGLTYSGHPLACAAAVAAIEAMTQERTIENADRLGREVLGPGLAEIADRHPIVGELRGVGAFWALELVRDRTSREPLVPYNAAGAANAPMAALTKACLRRGLLPFVNGSRTHVVPALNIGDDEARLRHGPAGRGPRRGRGVALGRTLASGQHRLRFALLDVGDLVEVDDRRPQLRDDDGPREVPAGQGPGVEFRGHGVQRGPQPPPALAVRVAQRAGNREEHARDLVQRIREPARWELSPEAAPCSTTTTIRRSATRRLRIAWSTGSSAARWALVSRAAPRRNGDSRRTSSADSRAARQAGSIPSVERASSSASYASSASPARAASALCRSARAIVVVTPVAASRSAGRALPGATKATPRATAPPIAASSQRPTYPPTGGGSAMTNTACSAAWLTRRGLSSISRTPVIAMSTTRPSCQPPRPMIRTSTSPRPTPMATPTAISSTRRRRCAYETPSPMMAATEAKKGAWWCSSCSADPPGECAPDGALHDAPP